MTWPFAEGVTLPPLCDSHSWVQEQAAIKWIDGWKGVKNKTQQLQFRTVMTEKKK